MLHKKRVHQLDVVADSLELARKLTAVTWCCCQGFQVAGAPYLFLNDSTGGDGAQEYAVVKMGSPPLQVETITFGWCSLTQALTLIDKALAGVFDASGSPVAVRVQTPEEHHRCAHCA